MGRRERVEFVQRSVADEVRPVGVVGGPPRLVDEHGHEPESKHPRPKNEPEEIRMAARSRSTRRGALSAAVVTGVVLGALLIQQVLVGTLVLVRAASFGAPAGEVFTASAITTLTSSGVSTVPLAIGVFVSLWQIAPIGSQLGIGHVLSRSMLAAGVGALLAFLVSSVVGVISDFFVYRGRIFDGGATSFAQQVPFTVGSGLITALSTFVTALPLVALAAVLLWIRLRDNDRGYRVEGMLDL